jgi:hypothetical protein
VRHRNAGSRAVATRPYSTGLAARSDLMSGPRRAAGSGQLAGDRRRGWTERRLCAADHAPLRALRAAIGAAFQASYRRWWKPELGADRPGSGPPPDQKEPPWKTRLPGSVRPPQRRSGGDRFGPVPGRLRRAHPRDEGYARGLRQFFAWCAERHLGPLDLDSRTSGAHRQTCRY